MDRFRRGVPTIRLAMVWLLGVPGGCLRLGYDESESAVVDPDGGPAGDIDGSDDSDGDADVGGMDGGKEAGAGAGGVGGMDGGVEAGTLPCDGGVPEYRLVKIVAGKVAGGPHADFPLLVSLTAGWLMDVAMADIHFAEDPEATMPLDHDVERYAPSTGRLVAWVRVPLLSAQTEFYIHYGACVLGSPQQNPAGVWDAYGGVWHLNDCRDATTQGNNCMNEGDTVSLVAAQIDDGMAFDADGDGLLNAGSDDASLDDVFSGGGVVSVWINPGRNPSVDGEPGYLGRIVSKAQPMTPTDFGWSFFMDPTDAGSVMFRHSFSGSVGHWSASIGATSSGQWHAVAVQYTSASSDDVPEFFVDGLPSGPGMFQLDPSGAPDSDIVSDLLIGNLEDGSRTFDGVIDEVRISRGTRAPEWFETEYNNQSDPAGFCTVEPP
jgi:hypothetical protein